MHTRTIKTWPVLLLMLLAGSSWAATQHGVTVGGPSTDGYTSPLSFAPRTLTISAGDSVVFTNAGGAHNVAADDGSFRCAQGCDGQGGNGDISTAAWSSTVTFSQAGTFPYHCDNHQSMGMTGTITVLAATPGNVPITAGFTGAWFDPAQSGHGILMEVLPNNLLVAYWYTFTPDGTQQSWFGGVGPISNDTAVVSVNMGLGGRWIPNFDPANFVVQPWGTLTITFSDCNHGHVDFVSTVAGYGSNQMDLTRLTQPAGTSCQ